MRDARAAQAGSEGLKTWEAARPMIEYKKPKKEGPEGGKTDPSKKVKGLAPKQGADKTTALQQKKKHGRVRDKDRGTDRGGDARANDQASGSGSGRAQEEDNNDEYRDIGSHFE